MRIALYARYSTTRLRALSLPAGEARDAIVTITHTIVAFSILVQGLTLG